MYDTEYIRPQSSYWMDIYISYVERLTHYHKHVDTLMIGVSAESYRYSLQGHAKGDPAAED